MRFRVHETGISMHFDPFGSFPAVMRVDSLIQTLRHPDVKRVRRSAKDVQEAHQEMMIAHEALRLARARSGPFDSASTSPFPIRMAARSVVMSEAVGRFEWPHGEEK